MSELSVDSASALSNASHGMPSATYIPQYSPPRSPKTYPPQSPSSYGHVYSPPRRYSNTKQHSPLGTSYENRNSGHYREPKRVIGCAIPRVVGFCGVDNSVDPWLLAIISRAYPWIEWGILFRPDMEGRPRYPTLDWVDHFLEIMEQEFRTLKCAGHLCGSRCVQVLEGDFSFVQRLADRGIKRVQVNATRANGVDVSLYGVEGLWKCIQSVPEVEWIIQRNEETRKLWEPIVHTLDSYGGHLDKTNVTISNDVYGHNAQEFPPPSSTLKPKDLPVDQNEADRREKEREREREENEIYSGNKKERMGFEAENRETTHDESLMCPQNVSLLYDASCGSGKFIGLNAVDFGLPPHNPFIRCGWAGGISADNIVAVLTSLAPLVQDERKKQTRIMWVDMESSLREIVKVKVKREDMCVPISNMNVNGDFKEKELSDNISTEAIKAKNDEVMIEVDRFSVDKVFQCLRAIEQANLRRKCIAPRNKLHGGRDHHHHHTNRNTTYEYPKGGYYNSRLRERVRDRGTRSDYGAYTQRSGFGTNNTNAWVRRPNEPYYPRRTGKF